MLPFLCSALQFKTSSCSFLNMYRDDPKPILSFVTGDKRIFLYYDSLQKGSFKNDSKLQTTVTENFEEETIFTRKIELLIDRFFVY